MKQEERNRVEIIFSTNEKIVSTFEENDQVINTAAGILVGKLLDYVQSGGDLKKLSPEKIFGKKEEL